MQQMINAVRSTGANNALMLGGEEYSNDLTGWLRNEPTDPDHNLVAENDCAGTYINPLTTWLESEKTSFLAWAWNADFNCSSGPGLITDYTGTPGQAIPPPGRAPFT